MSNPRFFPSLDSKEENKVTQSQRDAKAQEVIRSIEAIVHDQAAAAEALRNLPQLSQQTSINPNRNLHPSRQRRC
jgi:hypothetical protein